MDDALALRILNTKLSPNQVALWYMGQSGFIIQAGNTRLLIDAYLSNTADREAKNGEPGWKRRYPAPLPAEKLGFIDVVLCSHDHRDHIDSPTIETLARLNPGTLFISPAPTARKMISLGVSPECYIAARASCPIKCGEVTITPIPAAHETLHTDPGGDFLELGYTIEYNGIRVYHSGDCCVYEGLREKIEGVDIAMLPINGRDFYRLSKNIIGNMNSKEAVRLAREAHAKLLIPMHYDLYEPNGEDPGNFVRELYAAGGNLPFHMFMPGERYIYTAD